MNTLDYILIKPSEIPQEYYNSVLGIDIETEGLYIDDEICLLSFYRDKDSRVFIIPIKYYNDDYTECHRIEYDELCILKKFLAGIRAVGHNLQYDLSMIYHQWGVLINPYFDTYLLARVLQFKKQGLKDIVGNIKGNDLPHFKDIISEQKTPFKYTLNNDTLIYSAMDSVYPFDIIKHYSKEIKDNSRVLDIENRFLKVVIGIRGEGLNTDIAEYKSIISNIEIKYNKQKQILNESAGFECNPNSVKDKRELFNRKGITSPIKTPKGEPSVSLEVIDNILDTGGLNEEQITVLSNLKDVVHTSSVFNSLKKYDEWLKGDKVYPWVSQIGQDGTGRVYTKDPALQQAPKILRHIIKPDIGNKFVYADWKAAELYIASYLAKCSSILEWYNEGKDIHTEIAREFLNKQNIDDAERSMAKALSFAVIYGSEGDALKRIFAISRDDALVMMERYFKHFPELYKLRESVIHKAHEKGYIETMLGRKRVLENIKSDDITEVAKAERQAFNNTIQSSCADFFKIAACRLSDTRGCKFKIGVFDSFLFEIDSNTNSDEIHGIIDSAFDFDSMFRGLRFRYDMTEGYSWGECCSV